MGTLLAELKPSTRERIIQKALRANRRQILAALPKKLLYPNGQLRAVDWPRKTSEELCAQISNMMVGDTFAGQSKLDREVLHTWVTHAAQAPLVRQVRESLIADGYAPLSNLRFNDPSRQQLRPESIYTEGSNRYYHPTAAPLSDANPEEITLIAYLMGWSTSPPGLAKVISASDEAEIDEWPDEEDNLTDEEILENLNDFEPVDTYGQAGILYDSMPPELHPDDPLTIELSRVADGLFRTVVALRSGILPASPSLAALEPLVAAYDVRLAAAQSALGGPASSVHVNSERNLVHLFGLEAEVIARQAAGAARATLKLAALAELDRVALLAAVPDEEANALLQAVLSELAFATSQARAAVHADEEDTIRQLADGAHWLAVVRRLADQSLPMAQVERRVRDQLMLDYARVYIALQSNWLCLTESTSPSGPAVEPEPLAATNVEGGNEANQILPQQTGEPRVNDSPAMGAADVTDEAPVAPLPSLSVAAAPTSIPEPATSQPAVSDPPVEPQAAVPPNGEVVQADAPPAVQVALPTPSDFEDPATVITLAPARITGADVARRQWALLANGELSLPYHLARAYEAYEELGAEDEELLPAWLLRALLLSQHVHSPDEAVADQLAEVSAQFVEAQLADSANESGGARRLLAWAAALQPALLAPATQLNGWLSIGGVPQLPQLAALAQRIATRPSPEPLGVDLLGSVHNAQTWEADAAAWRERLAEWEREQKLAAFRGSPTNDIVKLWLGVFAPARAVGRVLQILRSPHTADAATDKQITSDLDLLSNNDRRELIVEAKRVGIDFGKHIHDNKDARIWFDDRVSRLRTLVNEFRELVRRRPGPAGQFDARRDGQLVDYLRRQCPLVTKELSDAIGSELDVTPRHTALRICLLAVERLQQWLMAPANTSITNDQGWRYWLGSALLRVPDLPASESGSWEEPVYTIGHWSALWEMAQGPLPDWQSVYAAAAQPPAPDHQTTARLLTLAATASGEPAVTIGLPLDELQREREQSIRQQQVVLLRAVENAERDLVRGRRYGYLGDETQRQAFQIELQQLRQTAQAQSDQPDDYIYNFRAHHRQLRRLTAEMQQSRLQRIAQTQREADTQLDALEIAPSEADVRKLRQAIADGRLALAEDYLTRLRNGETLEALSTTGEEPCIMTLSQRLTDLYDRSRQLPPARLLDHLLTHAPDTHEAPQADIESAFTAWQEVKALKSLVTREARSHAKRVLEFIGFELRKSSLPAPDPLPGRPGRELLTLEVVPLRDRRLCPVGRYGSEANGDYRLFSVSAPVEPAELFRMVAENTRQSATIVFLWYPLPWKKREELGVLCRREEGRFLVFDELFLYYLACYASPAQRLNQFFQLTLPFTHLNPYTGSGKIPTEMFYGRKSEKDSLVSSASDGAVIVYGGRQLGKTMLLNQAEREDHHPEREQYVVFLDIYQVGRDTPLDKLGNLLLMRLRQRDIGDFPEKWKDQRRLSEVLAHLVKWVKSVPNRRLLLLLDEADKLLEQDAAADFSVTDAFRQAMTDATQDTDRRFKVVFSGLHNVQRTLGRNLPNQLLAQFSKPIQIGPLSPEQGANLIRTPLESLGFCFTEAGHMEPYQASEALIDQIAVETNYYPSLIQIFCHQLVEVLHEQQRKTHRLITRISEDDVLRASQRARDEIRNRFDLTLDLNPRYKLLAYLIADITSQSAGSGPPPLGLTAAEALELAIGYWPAGWRTRSEESFVADLLDEMVKLSVLDTPTDTAEGKRYRLRTTNVRALLGTPYEIRKTLSDFATTQRIDDYLPSVVRAEVGGAGLRFRAPLTVSQARTLENPGVSVVCGLAAAGLHDMTDFLRKRFKGGFGTLTGVTSARALEAELRQIQEKIRYNTPSQAFVVWVTGGCSEEAIKSALSFVKKATHLRVIFEMDAASLRVFLRTSHSTLEALQNSGLDLIQLGPWDQLAIQDWLTREGFAHNHGAELYTATSGWHRALRRFLELEQVKRDASEHIRQVVQELQSPIERANWHLPDFKPYFLRLVRELLDPDTVFGAEEFDLLDEELPADEVRHELRWAAMLRLIQPRGDGRYVFDPVMHQLLRAQ